MYGPLPHYMCVLNIHLKNAVFNQQILFITGMITSRYMFIFWLKNPAAFQDDFWSLFINMWIVGYSILKQCSSFMMPGRYTFFYYICTGKNPLPAENVPLKSGLDLTILTLTMFFLHIFVVSRAYFYKQKHDPQPKQRIGFHRYSTESLFDLTTTIGIVLASTTISFMLWKLNQIKLAEFNYYPNYLYEYFVRMIAINLCELIVVLLHFKRNPKFRLAIKHEVINLFKY